MSRRYHAVCVAPVTCLHMSWPAALVWTRFTGVPHWDIPSTTETHVPVVIPFDWVFGVWNPASSGIPPAVSCGIALRWCASKRCIVSSPSPLAPAPTSPSSCLPLVSTLSPMLPSPARSCVAGGVDVGWWVWIGRWVWNCGRVGVSRCLERWWYVLCGWRRILHGRWLWPSLRVCVTPHSAWRPLSSHEVGELLLSRDQCRPQLPCFV